MEERKEKRKEGGRMKEDRLSKREERMRGEI